MSSAIEVWGSSRRGVAWLSGHDGRCRGSGCIPVSAPFNLDNTRITALGHCFGRSKTSQAPWRPPLHCQQQPLQLMVEWGTFLLNASLSFHQVTVASSHRSDSTPSALSSAHEAGQWISIHRIIKDQKYHRLCLLRFFSSCFSFLLVLTVAPSSLLSLLA